MARPSRRAGNLPAEATSFIGRRRELVELKQKLREARLVTLVGPGGVGKTRLAIRIAADLDRGFRHGGWLVELAELRDPMLVSNAVMAALDLRDQSGADPLTLLLSYLKERDLLLVIDNCEHLLDATRQLLATVMNAAPGIRVLATSREPLSIPGEHVVPVPPLELPTAQGEEPLHRIRENEAVTLFVERAAAASGGFELTGGNRAAVVDVCRRLDGLPLAIELAAVRTRVLGIEQIRDRLNDRFSLLTGGGRPALPRHQTLGTTIDWSHELLSGRERILFRRLCVFAGRFTLDDVQGICTPAGSAERADALNALSSLVDKSLVTKEEIRGVAVYRLHETMREYAVLKLKEAGEEEATGEHCTAYYQSRCRQSAVESRYQLAEWLGWMDLEIDNIRAVLSHCLARRDAARGIDLVTAVAWYWIVRATTEGVRWLDAFAAFGRSNPEAQFWAYFLRGFLAVLKADAAAAPQPLERAVAAARELKQPAMLAHALSIASVAANLSGDRPAATRLLDEARSLAPDLEDVSARLSVLQARALDGFFEGDIEAVRVVALEGVRLGRESGDLYSLEMMLLNLGGTYLFAGDLEQAKRFYTEALKIARRIDDRVAEYAVLDSLGCVACASGEARLGAQLIGAAETIRTQAGAQLIPILLPLLAQAEQSAIAALGESAFQAAVEAGRRLGREEAIRLALHEPAQPVTKVTRPQDGELRLLGRRQADVARLLAEGLSNKQIGARLFISERTVDSHVRSILNKLGFDSRAQIASWISSSDRTAT
jgi:predicted ATPase/DNA-binding CsgD family transcriptional regulator